MARTLLCRLGTAAALLGVALSTQAAIINGDFDSGSLSPWKTYTTANGAIGVPQVASFDTTGFGASLAAQFQVGQEVFVLGAPAGGGISQSFDSFAGEFSISVDIASLGGDFNNASGGLFSLLLNGVELANFDFDFIAAGAVERATLSYSGMITAGNHTLSIQAVRPFLSTSSLPLQYVDNVVVTLRPSHTVSEPASLALLGVALIGSALARRQRIRAPLRGSCRAA